ncbi:MAG TPA: hypothetical protein VF700_07430, partial [Segetibacter sp.]
QSINVFDFYQLFIKKRVGNSPFSFLPKMARVIILNVLKGKEDCCISTKSKSEWHNDDGVKNYRLASEIKK